MPELPEMETYRRLLEQRLANQRISDVEVTREKSLNVAVDVFTRSARGQRIIAVERRAKFLVFQLESGDGLLLHLMLGGWMYFGTDRDRPKRTVQVTLSFGENKLYFIGLRLGYLHLLNAQALEERLADLGPEPLDPGFSAERLHQVLRNRRGALKPVLVNQKVLAGIGNCYADEICFHAGLLPTRTIGTLSGDNWIALHRAMQHTLREAIDCGGYMEHPLFQGDVLTGGYNDRCRVYDRAKEPCIRCGSPIILDEVSGRKCFYCAECQR